MNYKESKKILKEIKKANKILITCHYAADADSVASSLALYDVLAKMGKKAKIINPSSLPGSVNMLKNVEKIKQVDVTKFDFNKYDLFLIPDIGSWNLVIAYNDIPIPDIELIVIDHHLDNEKFGEINLVDKAGSTCEILYLLFKDWDVKTDADLATTLLTGIVADTGAFQYDNVSSRTLSISGNLMELGARKDKIIRKILRSYDFDMVKYWGLLLSNLKLDKKHKFVWSAVNYDKYKHFKHLTKANSFGASIFSRMVNGTNFGVFMTEVAENALAVSLRERSGFDVSKIAKELGGGGHKSSAATEIRGLPFDEAVKKVLKVARKHAKKTKS